MLDQFRSLSGSLPAKILLGLLVLSFGVWGIGDMLRHPGRNVTVATVGGSAISGDEFARALHRETENVRRILGDNYSPEMLKTLHLPQQVLQKLVNRELLALESQSLGLVPSDAEVVRHIRANPAFQDDKGNFDKQRFEATLRNGNISEKTYVDQLRQDMASGLLLGTIDSAVPVPDAAVRTLYNARQEQRTVTIYALAPSLAANVPPPDNAQIAAYYDAHKSEFTAPEYRSLSYVTVTSADALATAISEDALKAAYKERGDEFRHPERRGVEQLLYASEDKAKAAELLLKNGKSIAEVAKTTDVLNKNALSLGKVERGNVLQNAADAVFSLHVGEHTPPIQSPFGWHIFHVSAIDEPSVAPFEEVRPQLEKDLKQRNADAGLNTLANKLEDALAGGATLAEAAKELGLKVSHIGPIDRQGAAPDGSKPTLPNLDKFLVAAFKAEDKTESPLMTAKGGYYILRVDSVIPERLRALDEVRGLALTGWQKEERNKRLAQLAKDIAAKFSDPAARAAAIAKYNLKPATGGAIMRSSTALGDLALPPELAADVFTHKPQDSTNAYPLKDGSYAIAVVGNIVPAPSPDKDAKLTAALADIRRNLTESAQNEILEQYTRSLAEKYSVSVNDAALESVMK